MTTVVVRAARVNTWFHALFTKPGLEVDGTGRTLNWGSNLVDIPPGAHDIAV